MNQPAAARALLQRGADMLQGSTARESYELLACPRRSTPLHVAAMQVRA